MAGTSANFRSRSSLTLENLESLPKNNRSVDSFITEQRRNAWFYASEALSVIDQPSAITSKPKTNYSKPNRFTSPLLKSRLEMQRGLSDADATPPIRKKSQQKELFKGFKHAREDRTERKISQKATNKSKRPRSSSDDEEEHSARLKERRHRKRARKEIIKPRAITPEQSIYGDADTEARQKQTKKYNGKKLEEAPETELTIRKKKGSGKTAAGISLMETFTANNVKKSRLTLQPQNHGRLFKQARAGETVKLGAKKKENGRSASKNSKPSGVLRKSKPNPLETYSNHALKASRKIKISPNPPKNHPKAAQSGTDSSDSNSNPVYEHCKYEKSKERHKGAHPSPCTEEEVGTKRSAAYSDSWGIGSQLPSDASSICTSRRITPRKATKAAQADATPSRASTVPSGPKITTLTTPWNFVDPQIAFGRFETLDEEVPRLARDTRGKGEYIPTTGQDQAASARSRFFSPPLVLIPEQVQNCGANLGPGEYVDTAVQPADAQDSATHQSRPTYTAAIADEQQTEYEMASIREPSPVNSLGRLLHEHDAEDALYGHLYVRSKKKTLLKKPSRVRAVQKYDMEPDLVTIDQLDDQEYHYENNEAFVSYNVGEDNDGDVARQGDVGQQAIDDPTWEEYDQEVSYGQEMIEPEQLNCYEDDHEEVNACQPSAYFDMDGIISVEDISAGDAGEVWQDVNEEGVWEAGGKPESLDAQIDAGTDMLAFAEGRTLLLGLGNESQFTRSLGHTGATAHYPSTYGQSVQEIEVMAARQFGHRW